MVTKATALETDVQPARSQAHVPCAPHALLHQYRSQLGLPQEVRAPYSGPLLPLATTGPPRAAGESPSPTPGAGDTQPVCCPPGRPWTCGEALWTYPGGRLPTSCGRANQSQEPELDQTRKVACLWPRELWVKVKVGLGLYRPLVHSSGDTAPATAHSPYLSWHLSYKRFTLATTCLQPVTANSRPATW